MDKAAPKTATLSFDGKTLELPMMSPSVGPDVIDVRRLYAEGDVFTYDPGFKSTASCDSSITYIDGDLGDPAVSRLSHRSAGRKIALPRSVLSAAVW